MSAIQTNRQSVASKKPESSSSWLDNPLGNSAAAMLIGLGIAFVAAESAEPRQGLCSCCQGYRDPRSSTAGCSNVFCSEECEREFVRTALASVTLDDCIRMQERLESLLAAAGKRAACVETA